jgi:hypothetical protein
VREIGDVVIPFMGSSELAMNLTARLTQARLSDRETACGSRDTRVAVDAELAIRKALGHDGQWVAGEAGCDAGVVNVVFVVVVVEPKSNEGKR